MSNGDCLLFVEFGGVNCEAVKMALEGEGFRVCCASRPEESLEALRQPPRPFLVLLDVTAPDEDTSRVIREVKGLQGPRPVPLVLLCRKGQVPGFLAAEADALLQKPVEFDDLLGAIRRYFRPFAPPGPGGEIKNGPPTPKNRILVVEDNRDGAESLRMLLGLLGYEVRLAHTGPEGVRAATEWNPDIIVSDIGLPGLDGYNLAREIRKATGAGGPRLIALTAYGNPEDRERAFQAGFDHHLTKPPDLSALMPLLEGKPGAVQPRDLSA